MCSAGAGRLGCLQAVLGVLQQGFGSRHCPGRVKTHLTQNGSQEIAIPSLLGRTARLLLKYPNESFRCVHSVHKDIGNILIELLEKVCKSS